MKTHASLSPEEQQRQIAAISEAQKMLSAVSGCLDFVMGSTVNLTEDIMTAIEWREVARNCRAFKNWSTALEKQLQSAVRKVIFPSQS